MAEKKLVPTLDKEVELSEKVEGIKLNDMGIGEKYRITTENTEYLLERRKDGFYISGNKKYCPTPRKAEIAGSRFHKQGSSIMDRFIGIGLYMEISWIEETPVEGPIVTSSIRNVEKVVEIEK